MKFNKPIPAVMLLALAALLARTAVVAANSVSRRYHLLSVAPLLSAGTITNFVGGFSAIRYDVRGTRTNQSVFINIGALFANTNYLVRVLHRGDTNLIDAATITSGRFGTAQFTFLDRPGLKPNKRKAPLPDAMKPVADILMVEVFFSTQSVFRADFTQRTEPKYNVQTPLTNNGLEPAATATFVVNSNYLLTQLTLKKTNVVTQIIDANHLTISAASLQPHTSYLIALNGVVTTNLTTDAAGDLALSAKDLAGELNLPLLPDGSVHIEQYIDVAIADVSSNIVLSTTVP